MEWFKTWYAIKKKKKTLMEIDWSEAQIYWLQIYDGID